MLINIENQIDEDEFIALTEREDVQDERLILVALVGHRMKFFERSGGGFKTISLRAGSHLRAWSQAKFPYLFYKIKLPTKYTKGLEVSILHVLSLYFIMYG